MNKAAQKIQWLGECEPHNFPAALSYLTLIYPPAIAKGIVLKKIKRGEPLSPILLVRDTANGKVVIADGYHRLCALYTFDEDALVRCKISDR